MRLLNRKPDTPRLARLGEREATRTGGFFASPVNYHAINNVKSQSNIPIYLSIIGTRGQDANARRKI